MPCSHFVILWGNYDKKDMCNYSKVFTPTRMQKLKKRKYKNNAYKYFILCLFYFDVFNTHIKDATSGFWKELLGEPV